VRTRNGLQRKISRREWRNVQSAEYRKVRYRKNPSFSRTTRFDFVLRKRDNIADAEKFALFGGWDAGVGGETVVVIEAGFSGPGLKGTAAHLAEFLGEAQDFFSGASIARGNGATRARMAALECDCADFKAHSVILVGAKEPVFPKCGNAVNFERGAETLARFV